MTATAGVEKKPHSMQEFELRDQETSYQKSCWNSLGKTWDFIVSSLLAHEPLAQKLLH